MNTKIAIVLAVALLAVASMAAEVSLTEEEQEKCAAEGGCLFTSVRFVRERIEAAYRAGFEKGSVSCRLKEEV